MKKTIRLTESDLHRIIKKSINESMTFYGDKMKNCLQQIMKACDEIDKYYDEQGGYVTDSEYSFTRWANKVYSEAYEYLNNESSIDD